MMSNIPEDEIFESASAAPFKFCVPVSCSTTKVATPLNAGLAKHSNVIWKLHRVITPECEESKNDLALYSSLVVPSTVSPNNSEALPPSPPLNLLKGYIEDLQVRLTLMASYKWTEDMEIQWNKAASKIDKLECKLKEKKIRLTSSAPVRSSEYRVEWTKFWEKKQDQLNKSGKGLDPRRRKNYITELNSCWSEHVSSVLEEEFYTKVKKIKKHYRVDLESLEYIQNPNPPPASTLSSASCSQSSALANSTQRRPQNTGQESNKPTDKLQFVKAQSEIKKRKFDESENCENFPTGTRGSRTTSTSSEESFQLEGFYTIQSIRLISGLKGHTEFIKNKLNHYLEIAEKMELGEKGSSRNLLNDEELVSYLHSFRDNLMARMEPKPLQNVAGGISYALGKILDLDTTRCKKLRREVPLAPVVSPNSFSWPWPAVSATRVVERDAHGIAVKLPEPVIAKDGDSADNLWYCPEVVNVMKNVPQKGKVETARILMEYLLNSGQGDISDANLKSLMRQIVIPMMKLPSMEKYL